jgi:hypothetical protein
MLHHRHRNDDQLVEVSTTAARPALLVGTAIGAAGIMLGLYTLVRVGLDTNDFSRPAVTVLHIEHTPLLALAEIGFGAVMILAGMAPRFGPIVIGVLCAILVACGAALLSASRTSRLHHWFGVVHHQGWTFVIVGALGLLAALVFPTTTRRTVVRSHAADPADTSDADRGSRAPFVSTEARTLDMPARSGAA